MGGARRWRSGYMAVMSIARLFLAPLALLAFAVPALAEKISLDDLSAYLNGITTAEAGFSQINSDGSTITGKVFIKRPGRVRFEYAPPESSLVLASGGQVAIFDAKSNQPPEQYPLKRTPLNLILAARVDLGRARMVTGHVEDGATTLVQAQDPEHPEYGSIELAFTADPIALRQWVITDDAGGQTAVILGPMAVGGDYPPSLFSITSETDKRLR